MFVQCGVDFVMASFDLLVVKNDSISVKLRSAQLKVDTIGKIFNVNPDSSLFLVGDDGTVAFPGEDGSFDSYDMENNIDWTVNGTRCEQSTSNHSTFQTPSGSVKARKWKPSLPSSLTPSSSTAGPSSSRLWPNKQLRQESKKLPSQSWTKTVEIC